MGIIADYAGVGANEVNLFSVSCMSAE